MPQQMNNHSARLTYPRAPGFECIDMVLAFVQLQRVAKERKGRMRGIGKTVEAEINGRDLSLRDRSRRKVAKD